MSRLERVFGSSVVKGRSVVLPHLYFTYLSIGLSSSIVFRLLGREVLVAMYSWYYMNSIDQILLGLAVIEMLVRVPIINRLRG